MTSALHLGKEYVGKTLDIEDKEKSNEDAIELASKIKIAVTSFQNLPKHVSLIAIVAARPQGDDETSAFAKDACKAGSLIEKRS